MKKKKQIKFFLLVVVFLVFIFNEYSLSQQFSCGFQPIQNLYTYPGPFTGLFKPIRTDLSGDNPAPSEAYYPILIVFVQFKNDVDYDWWHTNQPPQYLDSMISPIKKTSSQWWNAYDENKEMVSDYWLEVTQGKFHVCGNAYSIVLDSTASYYQTLGAQNAELVINAEIWKKLNSPAIGVNWQDYDRWKDSIVNNEKKFFYEHDNNVDFIYKVHKSTGNILFDKDGFSSLAWNNTSVRYEVDTVNHIWVDYGYSADGSGATVNRIGEKKRIFYTMSHEHGHFLYANGHITYGKVVYGPGSELNFSPYELMLFGIAKYSTADLNTQNTFTIGDYSGRDTTFDQFLKIPINNNESFVIANRCNLSRWDRVMTGDTVRIMETDMLTDYGKGAYIYHLFKQPVLPNGNEHVQDMECADGLWHWAYMGTERYYAYDKGFCWDGGTHWYKYKKDSVIYDNDNRNDSLSSRGDQKSFWKPMPFSIGQVNQNPCQIGTDRIYTNSEEFFPFDPSCGDRWDPWNKGYNEIFSPYSSPSTRTLANSNSSIYVYLYDNNNSNHTKTFQVYRAGYNGMTDSSILSITPPSRPMGITTEYYWESDQICHPKITWVQNQEPDMVNNSGKLKYKLYRAIRHYMNQVPGPPILIANDLEFFPNETPTYIDNQIIGYLSTLSGDEAWLYPVRYWVKAVDKYSDESVYSDFTSATGIYDGSTPVPPVGPDNFQANKNIPSSFDLKQNYPNPFNPVTNIEFDLPKDVLVTVKVFDVLGREIKTLVNEFKNAGSYIVSFNGSDLSSGIYFYRIQAGNFISVKRMTLIK